MILRQSPDSRALDQLKPVDKTIVVMSDLEGLSDKETAAALGLTVSAAKTRLHRARLFLRGKLAVALEHLGNPQAKDRHDGENKIGGRGAQS